MATHSSILAWAIPWTEEPGRLQSTGLQRVRHDFATEHTCARAHTHTHTHTEYVFTFLHFIQQNLWEFQWVIPCLLCLRNKYNCTFK